MTEVEFNPRFAAYSRAHNRSEDDQLAHDRKVSPGGSMVGFLLWNREQLLAFGAERPDCFCFGNLIDHDAYDAWLLETFSLDTLKQEPPHG
jgi:hypothetical protein